MIRLMLIFQCNYLLLEKLWLILKRRNKANLLWHIIVLRAKLNYVHV